MLLIGQTMAKVQGQNTTEHRRQTQEGVVSHEGENLPIRSGPDKQVLANLLLIVCILVFVVYLPALSAKALFLDDGQYLGNNPLVQNPSWNSVVRFFTEISEPSTVHGYYKPLTMISMMLDWAAGGWRDNLLPFHRTSLCLHLINTALVIVFLYLLFGQCLPAVAAGLIFGLHPLNANSVVWVAERKTVLATLFTLWSLIFYVYFVRKRMRKFFLLSLLAYVLACLSKPTGIMLPFLILLLDFWPLRRLSKRAVIEKTPFFSVFVFAAVITFISEGRAGVVALPPVPLTQIPLMLCYNIMFYLSKTVYPASLSAYYRPLQSFTLSQPVVLASLLGTCILIALLLLSLYKTRSLFTGWLFFFVAIFPAIGLVGIANVIVANRFMYLPLLGFLLPSVPFLAQFYAGSGSRPAALRVGMAAIVLTLGGAAGVTTRRYLMHWQDTITLYKHMLTVNPDAVVLHSNLGSILQSKGEWDEAISHHSKALRVKPNSSLVHYNLANALLLQGRWDEAINHYRKALQVKPDFAQAHCNLGRALQSRDKLDQAIGHYRKALQVSPDLVQAHNNLGEALIIRDKVNEALGHFREAIRLRPDSPEPLKNMAWILATHPDPRMRDPNQAVALAKQASQLTNREDAGILDTLAAAYAAAGRFNLAVATAQAALTLASASDDDELASQILERLQLYKQKRAYWQEKPI